MVPKEIISEALFDCYRGYNAETIADLKMRDQYQRDAQAERVMLALDAQGYKIVHKTKPK
jgi:type II secretory pathway component PulJ